jgi:hypothetical protein
MAQTIVHDTCPKCGHKVRFGGDFSKDPLNQKAWCINPLCEVHQENMVIDPIEVIYRKGEFEALEGM